MDSNEREVFHYLQTWGNEYVSVKEVCRRASTKKRYNDDPDWAKAILHIMVERGVLERDTMGRYRIKPKPKKKHDGRWVSPEIEKLLKENGVDVGANSTESTDLADDDYEQL